MKLQRALVLRAYLGTADAIFYAAPAGAVAAPQGEREHLSLIAEPDGIGRHEAMERKASPRRRVAGRAMPSSLTSQDRPAPTARVVRSEESKYRARIRLP
jgi:hypothetical protein